MSTLIEQIRSIVQDQPLFQSDHILAVAGQLTFQTKFFPIVEDSVIITPPSGSAPSFTVTDPQNGRITLASPGAVAGTYLFEYNSELLLDSTIQDIIDVTTVEGVLADTMIIAAYCLESMATQILIVLKKIKILDLQTDGPAVAKEMRAQAKTMRDLVLSEDVFDWVEMVYDGPSWAEKVFKDWERQDV